MNADVDTAIVSFANALERMLRYHHKQAGFVTAPPSVVIQRGPKYARIVREDGASNRSAYCFVDKATGDVLKPDGWKRPANGARGNIFDHNPIASCGPYGVAYLR